MKNLIYLFSIFLLFITSCASDPTELDVKDLEDPCDFVEALADNYKSQIALYEDNEDEPVDEWSKKDRKKLKKLQKLIRKIYKRSEKIIEDDFDEDEDDFEEEAEDCDGWDDFEELQEELADLENNSGDICACLRDAVDEDKARACFPYGTSDEDIIEIAVECAEKKAKEEEETSHESYCGGDAACGGCGGEETCGEYREDACGGCGEDDW